MPWPLPLALLTAAALCSAPAAATSLSEPFELCHDGVNDGGYGECAPGCVLGPYCDDGIAQQPYSVWLLCTDGARSEGTLWPADGECPSILDGSCLAAPLMSRPSALVGARTFWNETAQSVVTGGRVAAKLRASAPCSKPHRASS